jgi:hypothetical protein
MQLDLNDDETAALTRLLTNTIDADRYPLAQDSDTQGDPRQDPTGTGAGGVTAAEGLCANREPIEPPVGSDDGCGGVPGGSTNALSRHAPALHRPTTLECSMTAPVASKATAIMRLRLSAGRLCARCAPNHAVTA